MSWVKIDDALADNRKFVGLPPAVVGVWVLCLSWAHRDLRPGPRFGVVPTALPARYGDTDGSLAQALVDAGLWEPTEGGWRIHDFEDYLAPEDRPGVREARSRAGRASASARAARSESCTSPTPSQHVFSTCSVPAPTSVELTDPVPVPKPIPEEQLPTTATQSRAPTAQSLIDEWIAHCSERPPGRVVGQVAREIKTMLAEGVSYPRVRAGLAEWSRRGLHPSTLPSVVHELSTPRSRSGGLTAAELFAQAAAGGVA